MAKTNGKKHDGDGLTKLRQRLAGTSRRLSQLEGGLGEAVAERDKLAAMLPDLRSRGLVNGDADAKAELAQVNTRLSLLVELVSGYEYDVSRARADVSDLEGQLAEAERAEKAQRVADTLAKRDELARTFFDALHECGDLLAAMGEMTAEATRLGAEIGDGRAARWEPFARRLEQAASYELLVRHGRYGIALEYDAGRQQARQQKEA